jgi:hypothetical protein
MTHNKSKLRTKRHRTNRRKNKNTRHRKTLKSSRRVNRKRSATRMRKRSYVSSRRYRGKSRSRYHRQRGGSGLRSLLPTELVNLGDNIRYGVSSVAHDLVGSVNNPQNPMPHRGHLIDTNERIILPKVADLGKIYNESSVTVNNLYK